MQNLSPEEDPREGILQCFGKAWSHLNITEESCWIFIIMYIGKKEEKYSKRSMGLGHVILNTSYWIIWE